MRMSSQKYCSLRSKLYVCLKFLVHQICYILIYNMSMFRYKCFNEWTKPVQVNHVTLIIWYLRYIFQNAFSVVCPCMMFIDFRSILLSMLFLLCMCVMLIDSCSDYCMYPLRSHLLKEALFVLPFGTYIDVPHWSLF